MAAAKDYAEKVKQCITYDEELTNYYNKEMADGKWDGMMLSAHIGFTHWNDEDWKYPETVQGAVSDEDKLLVHAADSDLYRKERFLFLSLLLLVKKHICFRLRMPKMLCLM